MPTTMPTTCRCPSSADYIDGESEASVVFTPRMATGGYFDPVPPGNSPGPAPGPNKVPHPPPLCRGHACMPASALVQILISDAVPTPH